MRTIARSLIIVTIAAAAIAGVFAQNRPPSTHQSQADKETEAVKAFGKGNSLMEQRKWEEAVVYYKQALVLLPDDPSILFNTGLAAFRGKDLTLAADVWSKLKTVAPDDWHARAKLVQVYQALGKTAERDKERTELFQMWKSARSDKKAGDAEGDPKTRELKDQYQYCRDQFEVKGIQVMAFEHFELKGERALRYVFSILNKAEDGEEFRISLGSYEITNAIWRESKDPKPKDDERLFHLDGYFKNAHATYGMYFPEPTYDAVRAKVIEILEKNPNPLSSSTYRSSETKPTPKPSPQ